MTRPKEQLGKLVREAGDIFTVETAANVLGNNNTDTAKTLARWAKQGWITRIKRGLYAVVPIEATTTNRALEDAWVIVPELFSHCYIGGWSAAEHWDLTEQIFRSICVLTERNYSPKQQEVHSISFSLTKISPDLMFGTKAVWRKDKKILVSDPHKTILDMLYDPQLGGGIHHLIDCMKEYVNGAHYNAEKLIEYAERMDNGAVFKRLGFIAECLLGDEHSITEFCRKNLTKGNAYLDPKLKSAFLITRWRLFVPKNFKELA
jgi:predicted transcriptional regulator of viral defense system